MSSELRDPRFIFVCMQCKQKRTKTAAFKSPGGSAAHPPTFSAKETASAAGKSSKSEKAAGKTQGPSLFKAVVPPPKDRVSHLQIPSHNRYSYIFNILYWVKRNGR
jgi:hypothetical protein